MKFKNSLASLLISISCLLTSCTSINNTAIVKLDQDTIIRKMQDCTVFIDSGPKWGTGVVLYQDDEYAYIITDKHVLRTENNLMLGSAIVFHIEHDGVSMILGSGYRSEVFTYSDDQTDLALLKFDVKSHGKFKNTAKLKLQPIDVGSTIYHCGCPGGANNIITKGNIAGYENKSHHLSIFITAYTNHGSSGGGIYSEDGEMIGISQLLKDDRLGISLSSKDIIQWLTNIHCSFIFVKN